MDAIIAVLNGSMEMTEFLRLMKDKPSLGNSIREIVPEEAKGAPNHPFWKCVPYDALKTCAFDYMRFVEHTVHGPSAQEVGEAMRNELLQVIAEHPELKNNLQKIMPEGAVAHVNIPFEDNMPQHSSAKLTMDVCCTVFQSLKRAYLYKYPDFKCTDKYDRYMDLYLDAVGETFEGAEVEHIIEKIILDTYELKPKSKRLKEVKSRLKTAFHVEGSQYPRWIQGAEWPCGKNSPMKYISRKKIDDGAEYLFEDVDTGEQRTIVQYY